MSMPRSLKPGDDTTTRRILSLNQAQVPNADPTLSTHGVALPGADYLHIWVKFTGITAAAVTPWFYSSVPDAWFEGDQQTFDSTNGYFAVCETGGAERVAFVVDSVTGTGTLDLWAGYSYEGREA